MTSAFPAPIGMAAWAIVWITVVWQHGLYRMRTHWSLQADAARLTRALLLVAIAVFVVLFVIHLPQVSRLFLATLFGVQLVVALASRILIRTAFRLERGRGSSARFVLLAGTTPMAEQFADMIEAHRELGLRVIGHLGSPPAPGQPAPKRPILGTLEDVETRAPRADRRRGRDLPALQDWAFVEAITRICAEEGKLVRIPATARCRTLAGATWSSTAGARSSRSSTARTGS